MRRDSTPPSADASRRTPNHRQVIPKEVPDKGGIQNTTLGNPGALLRTVPLPVDEVLVTPAVTPYLQEAMDCPRRVVVDDPGWRWKWNGRRQRAGGDGLNVGDMECRVYTEGWRKLETNGTGVNNSLDLKGSNEMGGEIGGNSLQGKVLCPKPNPLSGSVLGGR